MKPEELESQEAVPLDDNLYPSLDAEIDDRLYPSLTDDAKQQFLSPVQPPPPDREQHKLKLTIGGSDMNLDQIEEVNL